MEQTVESLTERLAAMRPPLGLKRRAMSAQRKIILQVLVDNVGKHLSAEDVLYILRGKDIKVGQATVYRCLDSLAQQGILDRLDFGDGSHRYEINEGEERAHSHHHLVCRKCGAVMDFDEDLLGELEQRVEQQRGFKIIDHQVTFHGLCRDCQDKE